MVKGRVMKLCLLWYVLVVVVHSLRFWLVCEMVCDVVFSSLVGGGGSNGGLCGVVVMQWVV